MSVCEACNGEGIVGAGDFPLAKQGPITTCGVCAGTGKVVESEVSASDEVGVPPEGTGEAPSFLEESSEGSSESSEEGV